MKFLLKKNRKGQSYIILIEGKSFDGPSIFIVSNNPKMISIILILEHLVI